MNVLALALAAVLAAQAPPPPSELDTLKAELEKQRRHNTDLQRQLDSANVMLNRLEAEARAKADLKTIEEKRAQMERDKAQFKAATQALATPAPVPVTPAVAGTYYHFSLPEGRVTAVANEIDLVVISVGTDAGVVVGQEFTILRAGETVGTLKIDRADRKWAAGKVSKKTSDPRVGDTVGVAKQMAGEKHVTVFGVPGTTFPRTSADELRSIRKELDDVRTQIRELSDKIVPAWQGPGVSVEETPDELRAHLAILRGLLVRRVREGSPAEKAGLKANDVVPDLLEAQLVQAIEGGMPIHIIRQGQRIRLPGATGR